jgi:hypothetical protein
VIEDPALAAAPRATGVVFVHGIGTQPERETLFDWARPIVDVMTEWRREHDVLHPNAVVGANPVGAASVSDPANPFIELDIPAWEGRKRERWLLTEAYWAGDVRAPSFTDAIGYIRRRVVGIIRGITDGFAKREGKRHDRLAKLVRAHETNPDERVRRRVAEVRRSLDRRWALIDALDAVWALGPVRWVLAAVASVIVLVALAIYAPLRAIPIAAVRRKVESAALDLFLVDWFGDLPVILEDQSQAAAIRTRLLERITWLRKRGCGDIVLVAHSGGTIVSYAAMLRYSHDEMPVTKFVTLGEAIQLGWRLEKEANNWVAGNPIRGDLGARRPDLRWVDVWASYDPAPAGPFESLDECPLVTVDSLADRKPGSPIAIESRPVTNFMHIGLDHGGYWLNDEGFLIPLIRHIDDPAGDGSASRFYRDPLERTVRTERRRRRVSILLAWRWAAFAAAVAALLIAAVTPVDLATTGDGVAALWGRLPGHELVSGPVDGIGGAIAAGLGAVGLDGLAAWLGEVGPVVLGGLVPIVAVVIVYRRGIGSWTAHDKVERIAIRKENFGPPGRPSARSEGILLVGGLAAIVLAAGGPPIALLLAFIGGVALAAAAARAF